MVRKGKVSQVARICDAIGYIDRGPSDGARVGDVRTLLALSEAPSVLSDSSRPHLQLLLNRYRTGVTSRPLWHRDAHGRYHLTTSGKSRADTVPKALRVRNFTMEGRW